MNMKENIKSNIQSDSSAQSVRRRGRPKCFNEQQALEKAMLLFWQYGYEATSVNNLTQALGITAPSLYRSFGDKADLFHQCLDYYLQHEACAIDHIFSQAKTAKVAIELYLRENLKSLMQSNKPKGCMLVVATMNCSTENADLQQQLLEKRKQITAKIYQRLVEGQHLGEISENANLASMTDFYVTLLQGMTIQARDGASLQQLEYVVVNAMKAWDIFV
jgi:AcrR family transcriptional regulator